MRPQLVQPTRRELATRWRWIGGIGTAFLGVSAAALGGAALLPPSGMVTALAWSLLGLAAAYGAAAGAMTGTRARGLQAATAIAYAQAGAVLLLDPLIGPLLLLAAIAIAFVLGGSAQAIAAVLKRHAESRWEAGCGLLIIALGVAVAVQWPLPAVPALCVAFGFAAAAQGVAYIRLAAVGARRNVVALEEPVRP